MKIQLPNGQKLTLDLDISIEAKLQLVDDLTNEWDTTIQMGFDSKPVRFFLDGLANYLVWHKEKEDKQKQDKDVLSIKKVEQMEGKRKANSIPFSSLSTAKKDLLGLGGDINDD